MLCSFETLFPFAVWLCISHSVVTLGKEGECLICKAKCQLSPLSEKVSIFELYCSPDGIVMPVALGIVLTFVF